MTVSMGQWRTRIKFSRTFDPKFVVMIGFDLYGNNKLFNNIYKDTESYNESIKDATDPVMGYI